MVYDSARDRVVLFGGAASPTVTLADTWEWDGRVWQLMDVAGPSARAYSAAAYDSRRGRVVLHGGRGSDRLPLGDTWEWDGTTWHHVARDVPTARDHHAMAYDATRGIVVLFGGYDGSAVRADTWEWDGRAWRSKTAEGPPPRAAFAMTYDGASRRTIVYGGLWLGGLYADVWAWNGTGWTALTRPYANATLDHHAAAYDRERERTVFFGGKDYRSEARREFVELHGDALSTLPTDEPAPAPRYNTGLVYDDRRAQFIVFGGRIRDGEGFLAYGDLWTWDGRSWREITFEGR